MTLLAGYTLTDKLREAPGLVVYRGHGADGQRVIAFVADSERAPAGLSARLEHEYALRAELDPAWALLPLALVSEGASRLLVLADPGVTPLVTGRAGLPADEWLRVALAVARALGGVHAHGLVHKDLTPDAIYLLDSGGARLGGFGLATQLPRVRDADQAPAAVSGTLAYMAPEQTGRMNRAVDRRSDLYSLGVVLYELGCGALPFTAESPAGWLHGHVARQAPPLADRAPNLPPAFSAIVMKLLAKAAEERYQSSAGLAADLERCRLELETHGRVEPFELAQHDFSPELTIAEKLYGREGESQALLAAFDRVAQSGETELVLVSGEAGAGKSSLVAELGRLIVPPRGFFVSGKFDQYQQGVPYAPLAQCLHALVRPLLLEPESVLLAYRSALQAAVGNNGQLVLDLCPELELVIGGQPKVPEQGPSEAQNRLHGVLRSVFSLFAQHDRPLLLFLDDLQRLDPASLAFIEGLLRSAEARHLLLVGAYRDDEVGSEHALRVALRAVKSAGVRVLELHLRPLDAAQLARLLTDTLHGEPAPTRELAELVRDKTAGNPFFAIQFITALQERGLVSFDGAQRGWRWDVRRIADQGFTDNVVALMLTKLEGLPELTRRLLVALACVGNGASAGLLGAILGVNPGLAEKAAWVALRAELIAQRSGAYSFTHDRIQEAAYALLPAAERPAEHLRIARVLSASPREAGREEAAFALAEQFNRGGELLVEPVERALALELNAVAGRKSKAAGDSAAARGYFAHALALLPADAFDTRYEHTFALCLEQAECEFWLGNLERADELLDTLLAHARSNPDRARAHRLRARLYQVGGRYEEALRVGLSGLEQFGLGWPEPGEALASAVRAEFALVAQNLRGRPVAELALAPLATDADARAVIGLISEVLSAAYNAKSPHLPLLIAKGINFSLVHGNTEDSCLAYAFHAALTLALGGDVGGALEFSELSLRLNERLDDRKVRGRLLHMHGATINYRRRPFRTSHPILDEGFAVALEVGDLVYAAYISIISVWHHFESEESIEAVQGASHRYTAFLLQSKNENVYNVVRQYQQFFSCLAGRTRGPTSLEDDGFDELRCLGVFEQAGYGPGTTIHHVLKLILAFLHERYDDALEHAERAEARLADVLFSATETTQVFFHALALAAAHDRASEEAKPELLTAIRAKRDRIERWAAGCPENFGPRLALVDAELARLEGRELEAIGHYERAIASARAEGLVQKESLACELAAGFHRSRGFHESARGYLQRARAGYARWGAQRKVELIDRLHPELHEPAERAPGTSRIGASLGALDLEDVLRASQAVSDEIVLARSIEKLLGIVVDHAGAERGALLLAEADGLWLEAEARTTAQGVQIQLLHELPTPLALPSAVLRYVERTREAVILDDASANGLFVADEYVTRHASRSLLCLPLLKQARLVGVLYLENALASGVFTPERVTTLEVLAAQAAISLENAKLYAAVLAEVDERARREQALRVSEERFSKAFHKNPTPMAVIRARDGVLLDANESLQGLLGREREALLGRAAHELGSAFQQLVGELRVLDREGRSGQARELAAATTSGDARFLLVSNETIELEGERCFLASLTDVTERRQVEESLRQAQKMEAIGSLAGGIAHDFNNLLTLINGNSELAMMNMAGADPNYELVRSIFDSGQRAADLTRKLLAFSRKELFEPQVLRLDAIVADVEPMLRRLIPENVELCVRLDAEAGSVCADRVQVEQIILNLAINARDAMPDGGRLLVQVANVTLGPSWREALLEVHAGPHVVLAVEDSGVGMTPEVKARVFEPFFTTKEPGKGTGLGLAVVYGIVKQSGGNVTLTSQPGRGTAVRVYFPRVGASAEVDDERAHGPKSRPVHGQEVVLLVEDDPEVRRFTARALSSQGYRVLEAETGSAALTILEQERRRVDVVVTDIVMPVMGGIELGDKIRQRWPALPVLYVSGYSKDLGRRSELTDSGEAFLAKPFSPSDLARKVREILDRARGVTPAVQSTSKTSSD
jgi:PAS domain S-box-containing protein